MQIPRLNAPLIRALWNPYPSPFPKLLLLNASQAGQAQECLGTPVAPRRVSEQLARLEPLGATPVTMVP